MDYNTLWITPPAPDEIPVDLMMPEKSQIHGLFRQSWKVGDILRSMVTYLPEGFCHNNRAIIVAPPANVDPAVFLADSGLGALADRDKLLVCLLEPVDGQWTLADATFMNAAYKKVQGREYYVVMQDCIYAMGFGDGVNVAQEAARTMNSEWSGLATFGIPGADLFQACDTLSDIDAGTQSGEMFISGKQAQLPVWMLMEKENPAAARAIAYWNEKNHVQSQPVYDAEGTRIYLPELIKDTWKVNDDNIAQTRISTGFRMEDISASLLCRVWEYVGAARRHRGYNGKVLRYFRDPLKHGATYHSMVVDGMKREWYEYVPKRVLTENGAVPLVCVFHGRGGNGETFFDITDMSLVAEERGFIAVFPTADIYQIRKGGFRAVQLWNGDQNGKPFDSLPFVRAMIADIESRCPVDAGRIYACGQSSGGFMTAYCAFAASDLFAAVAPWSGLTMLGAGSGFEYPLDKDFEYGAVPIQLLVGKNDNFFGTDSVWPLGRELLLHKFIRYIIDRFGLLPEPQSYTCKPIDFSVWRNPKGIPMLVIGLVNDMPHANYPEESWISYDQFLCKFRKDANGKRYYMNRPIE